MWRTLFVSLMVLRSTAAFAGEVIVNHPIIRVVTSLKQLAGHCGVDGTYDACTQFVSYDLQASCASERLRASAAITPSIVLYNLASLPHEREHIADMHDSIRRYVDALESQTFDSDVMCRDAAAAAMQRFDATVRQFATDSLMLRDPTLRFYPFSSASSRSRAGSSR